MTYEIDDTRRPETPKKKPKVDPEAEVEAPIPVPNVGESTFRPSLKKKKTKPAATPQRTKLDPLDGDPSQKVRGTGESPRWVERILFGTISSGQLATLCRQFAAYLTAGVDIAKSLDSLQAQFARTALGPVLGRLHVAVRRGESLTDAMKRETYAFDPLFLGMMQVAETRGGVPETLKGLSKHYEARQRMIRQARSAMIYPTAVFLIASCVVAILTIWILPIFASMLMDIAGKGAQLPAASRILLAISGFVRTVGWFVIPAVLFGVPFALLAIYRTPAGKNILDRIALRIPVLGALLKKLDITRMARTLGALLHSGVDVGSSLSLTSDVLRLTPYKQAIDSIRKDVLHGEQLSVALDRTRRFSTDVIAVINSGEETGRLPETLDHLADDYEEQAEYMIKNLGQLVQPILMVFMGGCVLFIVLAVMLPYISLLSGLAK